ncbi:MAG: pentapeptide repeat-containing protein [Frankia sp.]
MDGANLTASLSGTNLTGAWLGEADLSGARSLTSKHLAAADGGGYTRLPAGVERPTWLPEAPREQG